MLWLKHSPVFKNLIKLSGISCLKEGSNRTFQEHAMPETQSGATAFIVRYSELWGMG